MGRTYVHPGDVLPLTAPAGGVVSGTPYKIGQLFVIAMVSAAEAAAFEGMTMGVHDLPKVSAQAWTEGALVYWDDTAKLVTTVATANLLIGVASAAAANPSATGRVRLNCAARANEAP